MRDRRHRPNPSQPAHPAVAVPETQTRALARKLSLDEQQKAYQSRYPAPHLFSRRPPG